MSRDHSWSHLRPRQHCLHLWLLAPSLVTAILMVTAHPATADLAPQALPPPVIDPHSTEICMNSRLSYHGGWSAGGTEQMLADVLHATACAPLTGTYRVIYAATSENVYTYDEEAHSLTAHRPGDWREDGSAAFEVGIAAERTVDAGAAMHLAQLESVALWTGTSSQLASCPRASATTHANSYWSPTDPIDIVISFGIRNVPGLTDELVAISSDGSLPDPQTDGAVFMDSALVELAYDTTFAAEELELADVSQLLWASYGCSDHWAAGTRGGLVCASAVAYYYLTQRIYSVDGEGAYRFHNRRPPGHDLTTRDHRIALITPGDVRPALRTAVPGLPTAPHYLIICVGETGSWPELEVGFAAVGAIVEASSMALQGYLTADLSPGEQAAIREATGIPPADLPTVVVSLGAPDAGSDAAEAPAQGELGLQLREKIVPGGHVHVRYSLAAETIIDLAFYDCMGRRVRQLAAGLQGSGRHSAVWDCRDGRGHPVLSGVYLCRLQAGDLEQTARVMVLR